MARCASGHHEGLVSDDAAKCCNGYRHELVIGDIAGCSTLGSEPLPGGVRSGYRWVRERQVSSNASAGGHPGRSGAGRSPCP